MREIHGFIVEFQFAAFDAGHIQYIIDKAKQIGVGRFDLLQAVQSLFAIRQHAFGNRGHAADRVHGRTDLMGHSGEEICLGLAYGIRFGLHDKGRNNLNHLF